MGKGLELWKQNIMGRETLAVRYPRLYAMPKKRNCLIAEMRHWREGDWKWRRKCFE